MAVCAMAGLLTIFCEHADRDTVYCFGKALIQIESELNDIPELHYKVCARLPLAEFQRYAAT